MHTRIMRWGSATLAVILGMAGSLSLLMLDVPQTASEALAPHAPRAILWPEIGLAQVASGLTLPVHITHADDGSGRLFIVEKSGQIKIVQDGTVYDTPFLDITDRITSTGGEQGLLSIAFSPDYADNGYFYVNYTRAPDGATVVSRFSVSDDPDVADSASETVLMTIDQPYANHNGGQIAFSPRDGYLYIGMGDGGSGGDPHNYAQNPQTLLGKMLRIDVTSEPGSYVIPESNPFVGNSSARDEIWALGLRNPWRFSFDLATSDLYIGDVGQSAYEEIDFQAAEEAGGRNYGWNIMEGFHCYDAETCDQAGLTLPVTEYNHGAGDCAVTGGRVYRGARYLRMQGVYFYADYCSGRIWGLTQDDADVWQTQQLYDAEFGITSFGVDAAGELYVADFQGGRIYHLYDPQPSLTLSTKSASSSIAYPGDTLTYTIRLVNSGDPLTETTYLTDTLPPNLIYVPDSLTATLGAVSDTGAALTWHGLLNPTSTVHISYRVTTTSQATGTMWAASAAVNQAVIDAQSAGTYTLRHTTIISPALIYLPLVRKSGP